MRIHCPQCQAEVELVNSVADSTVVCSRCKAVFDPRAKETLPPEGAPELLPGVRAGEGFGGYVLERRLGKGGMGTVFLATQLSLGRRVALKVLSEDLLRDPEFVRRFDAEARVLAALSHPNIVQVIDKGIERGHSFLVMEWVDGVSLRDLLNERRLSPADALRLIPQLCDALEYAHARGVVHRDIKPENILIARDGTPKIADFGLARLVGAPDRERITRSNAVMGSLDYMAPEQREKAKDADHRADIYALGVVLYEMLTGELPIGRFDPPSKKVKLEVDIDEVVLRVLSKDPERRYQRASEVGTEIRRRMAESGRGGAAEGRLPAGEDRRPGRQARRLAWPGWILPGVGAILSLVWAISANGMYDAQRWHGFQAGAPFHVFFAGIAGVAGALAWLAAIRNGYFPPMRRSLARWLRFPLVIGLGAIALGLPRPNDTIALAALAVLALAVLSRSPRLVEVSEEPSEKHREDGGDGKNAKEKKDMRVTIQPAAGAPAATFDIDDRTGTARAATAPPPPPAAPGAPPRPRLSLFALLGCLLGAAVFVVGAVGASALWYGRSAAWSALEEAALQDPRGVRGFILDARPTEIVPAVTLGLTVAGILAALVLAWNLAAFFGTGRRSGKRGRGLAFVGFLLTGAAALLVASNAQPYEGALREWRRWMTAPAGDDPWMTTGPLAERFLTVSALRWRTEPQWDGVLIKAASQDPSVAVRLAATAALGVKLDAVRSTPGQPTAALQATVAARRATLERALRERLADPAPQVASEAQAALREVVIGGMVDDLPRGDALRYEYDHGRLSRVWLGDGRWVEVDDRGRIRRVFEAPPSTRISPPPGDPPAERPGPAVR
jgi:predicted Ser/Thr protein kinase